MLREKTRERQLSSQNIVEIFVLTDEIFYMQKQTVSVNSKASRLKQLQTMAENAQMRLAELKLQYTPVINAATTSMLKHTAAVITKVIF